MLPLPAHHDHPRIAPRRGDRQRHQLGDAQAGGVEHFEQAIQPQRAQPLRRRDIGPGQFLGTGQHAVDVGDRQHLGQAAAALRPGQDRRRIVGSDLLVEQEAVEMPHRRQPPRHAGRLEAPGIEVSEVAAQRLGVGSAEIGAGMGEVTGEIGEVAPVGVERVAACALFRGEHIEEQRGQFGVGGLGGCPGLGLGGNLGCYGHAEIIAAIS
ncbi:hypothetical protein ACVMB0_001209 [Bradyrhizobium sp. USDA 4451]